jgi:hypothetical protein
MFTHLNLESFLKFQRVGKSLPHPMGVLSMLPNPPHAIYGKNQENQSLRTCRTSVQVAGGWHQVRYLVSGLRYWVPGTVLVTSIWCWVLCTGLLKRDVLLNRLLKSTGQGMLEWNRPWHVEINTGCQSMRGATFGTRTWWLQPPSCADYLVLSTWYQEPGTSTSTLHGTVPGACSLVSGIVYSC